MIKKIPSDGTIYEVLFELDKSVVALLISLNVGAHEKYIEQM